MIKILFVIPVYSHGGTNKSLENLMSFLDKTKYHIRVFSLYEDGGDYYKDVFKPYVIKKSRLYYWFHDNVITRKFMGLYNKITKRNNFTWLYKREVRYLQTCYNFNTIIAFQEGAATYFVSYFPRDVKKIAWIQCDYKDWASKKQREKDKPVYGLFNKIICVSETAKKSFCEVFPKYTNKSESVYNTLNIDLIKHLSQEDVTFPNSSPNSFNIISVGRFAAVKQFERIPSIINSIGEEYRQRIRWYIIGSGVPREEMFKEMKKNGMENIVVLLGQKDNPYPYIKKAHLYVCTSSSESFSYTIFESKILHTPVLSNSFPVAYEVLDNKCGWICSLDEMPDMIRNIITDKEHMYTKVKKSINYYKYNNNDIIKIIDSFL